ncbi:MAG: recombinase family protein [Pyrinomonadaceae bacterium]
MSQKKYFSYIRVSTQRQGQHGTSLAEQQASIERFAAGWKLPIVKRFEERETAAKQGRPVFLDMLKQLKSGQADGVIIHKIDRSARNLKDWADLGTLIDGGIEVHFASESLDLNSRGGRLSADIQAVVASDYIRNLSEEAKKGLYGRLKQGLYPFRAMVGYLDRGSGKRKEIDPETAPLIRRAFELYATSDWGLQDLTDEMNRCGLNTKRGNKTVRSGLARILHNPFYIGVIHIKKTGERFVGIHDPIVTRDLYDRCQWVFAGKNVKKSTLLFFKYRRMVTCGECSYTMSPEIQKGLTYYRCHYRDCIRLSVREEVINAAIAREFKRLELLPVEREILRKLSDVHASQAETDANTFRQSAQMQLEKLRQRNSKLAEVYMEGTFDQETYVQKKNELVLQEQSLKEKMQSPQLDGREIVSELNDFFQLANSAYLSYELANPEERRDLVRKITSNLTVEGKYVSIKLKTPFDLVANRTPVQHGWPYRTAVRTITPLLEKVRQYIEKSLDSDQSDE